MTGNYANQFAPVGFGGLPNGAPDGYVDKPFDYVFDVTLTTFQTLLSQQIPIQTDSAFLARGVYISSATGLFSFRWSDANNWYHSDGLISSANFSTFAGQPFVILPEEMYPAGSKLTIDISDTSGSTNVIELVFTGVKRYAK